MNSIKEKLINGNQKEILTYLESIEGEEKENLIKQIEQIDFNKMLELYNETKIKKEINDEITPIDYINPENLSQEEKKEAIELGESVIKNDQYAVVTMAGGQGTRLGFSGPKGTYKLDFGSFSKYIFQILTENLLISKEKYGVIPYWYIMTSVQNDKETRDFFERNNYFGYEKEKVKFFKQGTLPLLTPEGNMLIDEETKLIKNAADGNGGVYTALKNEKMIDDMKSKKIKWVFICGVDNIMVNPIDSLFLGLTIKSNCDVASKSIVKAYPDEKIGAFCKKNGKPAVIEYIELTEEMRNQRNLAGDLVYGESNFVSNLFSIEAIEKISTQKLRYHLAIKNNLYKFESFIFDAFELFDQMLIMRIDRNKEFSPIKNKEGVDSPETAKEIYMKNHLKK